MQQQQQQCSVLDALKLCARRKDLALGRRLHAAAVESGEARSIYVSSTLVSMYAKCGSMREAQEAFEAIRSPNAVSWTALISGYADCGQEEVALQAFARMAREGCSPDSLTFVAALKCCARLATRGERKGWCLSKGMAVHGYAAGMCCDSDSYVANTLVDMYAKCGRLDLARSVFESMRSRSTVAWNCMILRCADEGEAALELFSRMAREGCPTDEATFVAALKACANLAQRKDQGEGFCRKACLAKGARIHGEAAAKGFDVDMYVASRLTDMYAKLDCMVEALKAFETIQNPDAVVWTALISGFAENGNGGTGMELFARMQREGCAPDALTFVAALKACTALVNLGKLACVKRGSVLHEHAFALGCDRDFRVANALVDMYTKCGFMSSARQVFESMPRRNVIAWNCLVLGYVENGQAKTALEQLSRMLLEGCHPDAVTFIAALKACGALSYLERGRRIHEQICCCGLRDAAAVANTLVDFYGKCCNMEEAQRVFDSIAVKSTVSWNALMCGYSHLGNTSRVLELFDRMRSELMQPNGVTFLCILSACSHSGLVCEGSAFLEEMQCKFGIVPGFEHYNCMIDLLCRVNELDAALGLVKQMPYKACALTWRTILAASVKWRNVGVSRLAFQSLVELQPHNHTAYVLMANSLG